MIRTLKSLLAIAAIAIAGASHAADVKELNFGIIATEKAGALRQMWEPFLEDMSKAVGVKVFIGWAMAGYWHWSRIKLVSGEMGAMR